MTAALSNTAPGTPFATGVDAFVYPQFIGYALRAPTSQDIYNPGTRWQNNSVNPPEIYETTGAGVWNAGAGNPATATTYGTVELSPYATWTTGAAPAYPAAVVPNANDVYTFVGTFASAGGVPASTTQQGITYLATNAQASAGLISADYAIVPSSLAYAIANGVFTASFGALTSVGTASINASGTAATTIGGSSGAITLAVGAGNFSLTGGGNTVGIANDAASNTVTVGSTSGTSSLTLQAGSGGITLTGAITTGALTVVGTTLINHTGNANTTIGNASGSGAITIYVPSGNFAVVGSGNTIGIGNDAAANTVVVGSSTASASLTLQSGSGGNTVIAGNVAATILIGATSQTGTITLGSSTAANSVLIQNGVNTGSQITSINNGACGANSTVNVLSGVTTTGTQVFNLFAAAGASTAQTINMFSAANTNTTNTFNIGSSTGTLVTCNWLTGAVAHVLNLGSTSAGAFLIRSGTSITLSGTTTTTYAIGGSATTGTILIGGTAQTGNITLGSSSGTNSVLIGNGAGAGTVSIASVTTVGATVNIANAASIGTANTVNVMAGATPGASMTLNLITGAASTGTQTINVLTGTSTGGTQTFNLATGSSPAVVNIGNAAAGNITITNGSSAITAIVGSGGTINIGHDANANTINIGNGAAANTVALGSTNTTSTTTINGGSGGVNITGANLQIATAGKFLEIKGASFAATNSIGVGTLSSGTVTINNTNIASGDVILLTRTGANGSTTFGVLTYTISASTSFTVTSLILGTPGSTQTGDTSTFSYIIVRPT